MLSTLSHQLFFKSSDKSGAFTSSTGISIIGFSVSLVFGISELASFSLWKRCDHSH
jgi:hypothetical protein